MATLVPYTSCKLAKRIDGEDCIGSSRSTINDNFAALETISCDLSSLTTNLSGSIGSLLACCTEVREGISSVARTLAQLRISPSPTQAVVVEDFVNVSTIYIHPYNGNTVGMYNTVTNRWEPARLPGVISVPLAGLGVNTNYSVFLEYDGSNFNVNFIPWSSVYMSASAGVPAPNYSLQNGVRVNPTTPYNGRLIGCLRTTNLGQTEVSFGRKWVLGGSHPKFFIWNAQNQVPAAFSIYDGAHWDITGPGRGSAGNNGPFSNFGYRSPSNKGIGNRVSFITGDAQEIELYQSHWSNGGWAYLTHGLNLDQDLNPYVVDFHRQGQQVAEEQGQIIHNSKFIVSPGFHYVQEMAMSYGGMNYWVFEGPTSGGNSQYPGGRHSYGAVGTIARI